MLSVEGEGRGWSNHFFFLSSELQQIVETPCTPQQDTVCGCQKNQYQTDSESEFFQCRNCSLCANGFITSCEYGVDMALVQMYCSRVDFLIICSALQDGSFGTALGFFCPLSPKRLLFFACSGISPCFLSQLLSFVLEQFLGFGCCEELLST